MPGGGGAKYSVSLVRPDGSVSAINTYSTAAARDAKAAEWQADIDSGQLPGYHVTKSNDYTDGDGPLDPDQN